MVERLAGGYRELGVFTAAPNQTFLLADEALE